jgi:AraC-like DNA-binding protein
MSLQLIFFSADAIAVFSLLLFGLRVLLVYPKQLNARLIAWMCLNSVCAIVLSRQELSFWIADAYRIDVGVLRLPFHIARNLTPGLLTFLSYSLFQDKAKFPRWLIAAFIAQITIEALALRFAPEGYASQYDWMKTLPAVIELLFVGLAVYWLLSGWRADLVEARRRLRLVFLVLIGILTFMDVLLGRLLIPWSTDGTFYLHAIESMLIIVLVNVALLTAVQPTEPSYVDPFRDEKTRPTPESDRAPTENHDPAVATILKAFRVQHVYRDGELTIASLATKLSMPEYRLRKLIHEQLGYRNFNALLHEYRIEEACRELSDPKKDHLPILTIALTVGYNSINPFNRAFRDAKGMTPSAFRTQAQEKTSPILEN